MSPTVFREGGFRFYFFSREETRMHVNVQGQNGEAKSGSNRWSNWLNSPDFPAANWTKPDTWFRSMKMTSATVGASTSSVEVTNISPHGFGLLLEEEELFLPFAEFPWFRDAAVGKLAHVEWPSPGHLYWPELDVDLAVESIRHPERFPLVSRAHASP
ncbi:MAG TPA: DUF2442 domain-containing protein [Thiobacillaceae bacterium]|nr:DUF2442 domain-containing protein [Thiobacillaceae bacterium]